MSNLPACYQLTEQQREYVHRRATNYRPRSLPEGRWKVVRSFTVESVCEFFERTGTSLVLPGPPDPPGRIVQVLYCAAHLADHAAGLGWQLDRPTVFGKRNIEQVITTLRGKYSHVATSDQIMRYLGDVLGPGGDLTCAGSHTFLDRETQSPYSAEELVQVHLWANAQPTPLTRQRAHTVVALCLGVGANQKVLRYLKGRDVTVDDSGVVWVDMRCGRQPAYASHLPVATRYAETVIKAARHVGDNSRLLTGAGSVKDKMGALNKVWPHFRVSLYRLRATWVLAVLKSGLPRELSDSVLGRVDNKEFDIWLRTDPNRPLEPRDCLLRLLDPYADWVNVIPGSALASVSDISEGTTPDPSNAQRKELLTLLGEHGSATDRPSLHVIDGGGDRP
ncbi:hypothetical protein [Corynebacterium cystitidis]|uniref:hypothetical protein n=1 Tax=Corynebacterium cystitidis TaxID=35757 RepID=UPI00211EF8A0|nr:hypothetical protein [Corynebacterium cystitidis]